MNRITALTLTTITLAIVVLAGGALAQQRQHVSYKVGAENSKYTQQQNVDLRDVPNHLLRIFDVHRTFPTNAPVVNGLKIVEAWNSGIADRIDGVGPLTEYDVYVAGEGDKFFCRVDGMSQQVSPGRFTVTTFGPITGGTGKFTGIEGTVRAFATFEPATGFNETQIDIEYSIGK
jgi:hypothetical protein